MKNVLIALHSSVLASGIESILNSGDGLAVSRVTLLDHQFVPAEGEWLLPTVLVLDEAQALEQIRPLVDLFQAHAGLKILVVNPENNIVHIYERRELCLQAGADLVQVVQSM